MALDDALTWVGFHLDDVFGARVGRVEDVYIDELSGQPVWLVARLGRFGDELAVVPATNAAGGDGHVWVPYERQLIRSAPFPEAGVPLTRERELELATHFDVGSRAGRVGNLPGGAVTATPVIAHEGRMVTGARVLS